MWSAGWRLLQNPTVVTGLIVVVLVGLALVTGTLARLRPWLRAVAQRGRTAKAEAEAGTQLAEATRGQLAAAGRHLRAARRDATEGAATEQIAALERQVALLTDSVSAMTSRQPDGSSPTDSGLDQLVASEALERTARSLRDGAHA
jgi:hypothetical protein